MTGIAFLIAVGWLAYHWYAQQPTSTVPLSALPGDELLVPATQDKPMSTAEVELPARPRSAGEEAAAHPVEVLPALSPLPSLAESDPEILAALIDLLDQPTLAQYFQLDSMARKFVIGVDNLPSGKLAPQNRLLKPVSGTFAVLETEHELALNAENFQRYTPLVRVITGLDVTQVARLYRQFYPLLQQAYEDLGYPGRHFNDRLIAVIDHLLTVTPSSTASRLVQPKVFYVYADPDLEASSAGHKILLRIGPSHMASVQQWLTAMRAQLASETSGVVDSPQ